MQRTGGYGLRPSGDLHVVQGGGSQPGAALARGGGARLISRPILLVQVRSEVGDVSAVELDTPQPPLPSVLIAQGLELCFNLALMVHIIADLHVLRGSFPLRPRVPVLLVPLQPPHEATIDAQAGLLGAVHRAWMWLWLWLLVRKMKRVVDDEVLEVGVLVGPRVARLDWVPQRR